MKGITYFSSNTGVDRPIYHRDNSCGNRGALHEMNCSQVYDDSNEFDRRSQKARKCYIERLVYDEIFGMYFPSGEQNSRHREMVMNTGRGKNMFMTCFPSTVLEISVEWTKDYVFPHRLFITTTNPSKYKTEVYQKTANGYDSRTSNVDMIEKLNVNVANIYKRQVSCTRSVYDNETKVTIFNDKVQTFDSPIAWKEIEIELYDRSA
jgi:hypothetical protein